MKNRYWLIVRLVIALILGAVLVTGCKKGDTSSSPGTISNVTVAAAVDKNDRTLQPTKVFTTDANAFYCSFKLSGFPPSTKIKAELVYMGGEAEGQVGKGVLLMGRTGTIGGQGYTSVAFERSLLDSDRWPKGDYQVVLSVGDVEKASVSFKVE